MSTSVGMDQSNTVGLDQTDSVGRMKHTSVVGNVRTFITGELTETIEGDVHSETKQERNEVSEGKIVVQSKDNFEYHSDKEVKNNSGEKGNNF